MKASIRTRILIAFLAIALLPAIAVASISSLVTVRYGQERAREEIQSIELTKEAELVRWAKRRQSELDGILRDDRLKARIQGALAGDAIQQERIRQTLRRYAVRFGTFEDFFLFDSAGRLRMATAGPFPRIENKRVSIYSEAEHSLLFFHPFPGGVLVGETNLNVLRDILREENPLGKTIECYLVSPEQKLLLPTLLGGRAGERIDTLAVREALRTRGNGFGTYEDYRKVSVNGSYRWLPELGVLLISEQDQAEAQRLTRTILGIMLTIAGLSALLAILAAVALSRSLLGPLSTLLTRMQTTAGGDLSQEAPVEREDELGQLAASFNRMLDSLRRARAELEERAQESQRGEAAMKLQRDLALSLGSINNLHEALAQILETALRITGVTLGGIYLVNEENGIDLIVHQGLSPAFAESVAHYPPDSPRAKMVRAGRNLYLNYATIPGAQEEFERFGNRHFRGFALIPVKSEGKIVASLNLLSSEYDEIPETARAPLEALAAQIGGVIARIKAEEAVKTLNAELEQRVRERTRQLEAAGEEKNRLIESLRQADRLKDEFLSLISHELRTPLNAITGFGSLLYDEVPGALNERQLDFVARIMRSSDLMLGLVSNLLDMARMQAGRFEIAPDWTNYPPLVEDVLDSLRPLFRDKHLEVSSDLRVPAPVWLDGARIAQVLTNLLSNAIKFTPDGGTISVRAFLTENRLLTEVQDNGIGIKEEDLAELFLPFKQVDMSATRKFTGTGLGLSIAKGIVERHGGTIEVQSPGPGKGTTFRFILPLKP